jgi:hypothetical protein
MSAYAKTSLQAVIGRIPKVRLYSWDTSPYETVAEWEASALAAVRRAFGKDSKEAKELSAAISDESWKNTNRPDAVSPEVFVNRDFQARMDSTEKMLRGYAARMPAARPAARQKPRKARRAPTKKRRRGGKKGRKKPRATRRRNTKKIKRRPSKSRVKK